MYFIIARFDASKTCVEPSVKVVKQKKVIEVKICHLTQFALFWTFDAENGMFEFKQISNGMFPPSM